MGFAMTQDLGLEPGSCVRITRDRKRDVLIGSERIGDQFGHTVREERACRHAPAKCRPGQ